jgi:hypothetical protein
MSGYKLESSPRIEPNGRIFWCQRKFWFYIIGKNVFTRSGFPRKDHRSMKLCWPRYRCILCGSLMCFHNIKSACWFGHDTHIIEQIGVAVKLPTSVQEIIIIFMVLQLFVGPCSVSWSYTQSVGHPERGISPSAQYRHQCVECDSNPRSQHSSEQRQLTRGHLDRLVISIECIKLICDGRSCLFIRLSAYFISETSEWISVTAFIGFWVKSCKRKLT